MSKFSSTIKVRLFGIFALAALAATVATQAQTAPQLLPYTTRLIAGSGTATIAAGGACPLSGFTSTDAYGDGCLANEVKLSAPRFVATDKNGVVFFSDSGNGLIRRVDPTTGIITAVAGGAASSPASGATCGAYKSTDSDGDGCLANAVKISKPEGLRFSAVGDLYFADNGYDNVRKIAATNGVITTTGVITQIVGGPSYGYNVNNTSASGPVNAATLGYINFPYGIAFDAAGNLYIADEGNNALSVVNLGATTATIQGMSVPAGTIAKFAGYGNAKSTTPAVTANATSGDCPDFGSAAYPSGYRGGCYFGSFKDGALGNVSNIDGNYDIAVDATGNVFFANEFNEDVPKITTANVIANYAGIQGTKGTVIKRGPAGSFGIGSNFNLALDTAGNLYTSDAVNGVIWRVDAGTQSMYAVAGGGATACSAATDAYGDGCPGTQSIFSIGTLNASGYATAPGVAGLAADAFSGSLFVTDATTSLIREVSSGADFGIVGANQPTDTLDVHFAINDGPASAGAYTITANPTNFTVGAAVCTTNSDNTMDCLLPVTATPTTLGAFTGTLQVKSSLGTVASFTLTGTYVVTPFTRTAVTVNTGVTCAGATSISTATAVTLTATVTSSGTPTGTVQFFANGAAIGAAQPVSSGSATLKYSFTTPGAYTISATYSGDSYFKASTGTSTTTVTTTTSSYSVTMNPTPESTVNAGGTALYAFTVTQNVFTGTLSFSCSGLPAFATCSFSPASLTGTGCSSSSTVALNIYTQQPTPIKSGSIGIPGRGPWALLGVLPGVLLALGIGLRRRRLPVRFGQIAMAFALLMAASGFVACGSGKPTPGTPAFSGNITVTVSSSAGTPFSLPIPLTIN